MRTISALACAGLLALAACSSAAAPPPSRTPAAPTEFELHLLSGIRLDLQGTCVPLRDDLPTSAVGAIECRPASDVVERAALFLFDTEDDLLDVYLAWLLAHGIELRSEGVCAIDRPSEGAWVMLGDGPDHAAERGACYVDPSGKEHHATTLPPFVLAEVDGRVAGAEGVGTYVWLGNQDTPGAPTIWRSEGPLSPEK